jgi:hypothetical protein
VAGKEAFQKDLPLPQINVDAQEKLGDCDGFIRALGEKKSNRPDCGRDAKRQVCRAGRPAGRPEIEWRGRKRAVDCCGSAAQRLALWL